MSDEAEKTVHENDQKPAPTVDNKTVNLAVFLQMRVENAIDGAAIIAIEPQTKISKEGFAALAAASYDAALSTALMKRFQVRRELEAVATAGDSVGAAS